MVHKVQIYHALYAPPPPFIQQRQREATTTTRISMFVWCVQTWSPMASEFSNSNLNFNDQDYTNNYSYHQQQEAHTANERGKTRTPYKLTFVLSFLLACSYSNMQACRRRHRLGNIQPTNNKNIQRRRQQQLPARRANQTRPDQTRPD